MPIDWEALGGLKGSDHWTVRTAREHLSFQQADPWEGYWACRQTLGAGMKAMGVTAASPRHRK
jgi:bifunctional non-homologous end joining protein LigD